MIAFEAIIAQQAVIRIVGNNVVDYQGKKPGWQFQSLY